MPWGITGVGSGLFWGTPDRFTPVSHGANFVGFRVLPDRIRVRNDNLRWARKRMKWLQREYEAGSITLKPLVQRLQSWEAHLLHGDTYRLRGRVFGAYGFRRKEDPRPPRFSKPRRSDKIRGADAPEEEAHIFLF